MFVGLSTLTSETLHRSWTSLVLCVLLCSVGLTNAIIAFVRPSKGVFDVALSLVCQPPCRLFGKGQMSPSLFRYNTNVAVVLNLCDAVSNFYNLLLLVPVSEDQPHIRLRITLRINF